MRQPSPRRLARMIGLLFLLTILFGIFAQGFVSERLGFASKVIEAPKSMRFRRVAAGRTLARPFKAGEESKVYVRRVSDA